MRFFSLTTRLTLLFSLASSVVLLALGLLVGSQAEKHFEEQDMEILTGKLELTRHALLRVNAPADLDGLAQLLDEALVGHSGLAVVVLGPRQEVIFATSGASFPQPLIATDATVHPSKPLVWIQNGMSFRGIAARLPTGVANWPPLHVAIATDIAHHLAFMASFRITLWYFITCAAAFTGLLGWAVARSSLAPLRTMREKAAAVTAAQLDQRLQVDAVPPELAALAQTLNEMLARLQDSFRRLADFSSDIAHELRTPVSNLMTQTQVCLSRARTAEDYRAALESNAEEFDRLARMISEMLFLAKADNGLFTLRREPVDLGEEARKLCEFYNVLAAERHIILQQTGAGRVEGDRQMIGRALSNLLANAIHHSLAGKAVSIEIETESNRVCVRIANEGATIPAEHLDRLFDRFYRVDASRQRNDEGVGLGLAIVKSIVFAHGGEVGVRSADGRTEFSVQLPVSR